ncbi:hypothetical protein HYFRA_00007661 [Hymenoscyphus fraxineus]|uniref:DNase1 protein n=1 Tax=Hymenoscyphus fraxineus TaxID=746836 RepID=A0A9N9KSV3_9HELO|nr:hypothetical protein HYFRA_00007661 [Hymenoscyphus fraxineus]
MQFFNTLFIAASALATLTAATKDTPSTSKSPNKVHFVNQDSTQRTIHFTPQIGTPPIAPLSLNASGSATATFPIGWIGNWYSVSKGRKNIPGMLGEVRFDGYAGATYFDVSAIVNPDDNEGVKMLMPMKGQKPMSGCLDFTTRCGNAYNKWDDVQTMATLEKELICFVGNGGKESDGKRGRVGRRFVEA